MQLISKNSITNFSLVLLLVLSLFITSFQSITFAVNNEVENDIQFNITEVTEDSFTFTWDKTEKIKNIYMSIRSETNFNETSDYKIDGKSGKYTVSDLLSNETHSVIAKINYENGFSLDKDFILKTNGNDANAEKVNFKSENLKKIVSEQLGVYTRQLTVADINKLHNLVIENSDVNSLNDLTKATNLVYLKIKNSKFPVEDLSNLTNIQVLELENNGITQFPNLNRLDKLRELFLTGEKFTNFSDLKVIPNLKELFVYEMFITDLNIVQELKHKGVTVFLGTGLWKEKEIDPDVVNNAFPENDEFDVNVNEDGTIITINLTESERETVELTTDQLKVLNNSNQRIEILRDNLSLSIPVTVFLDPNYPINIEMKKLVADVDSKYSNIYDLTITQYGQEIDKFYHPVTLTFDVNITDEINPENLKIHYFNENTEKWELVGNGGTYDNGKISVMTNHFSKFTVLNVDEDFDGGDSGTDENAPDPNEGDAGSDENGTGPNEDDSKSDDGESIKNKNYLTTKYGNYFQVINDEAIVYDNRTGKLVKIGKLVKGETYPIVSDYGNWHRIQFGNIYGYVHKQNTDRGNVNTIKNLNRNYKQSTEKFVAKRTTVVYDNSSSKLVPFAEIDKGQVYPIVSDYGNWYRVLLSGRVGYVKKSDVNGYFNKTSKYFEVTEEGLPVYDNRSGSLKKIGELKKGQVYERVSDYGNWHRIQFGKIYGYVRKDSTLVSTRNKVPNLNTRYKHSNLSFITKKRAVVYDNTSGKLVPFATLEKGQSYPIVSDYGNWYRIIVSNKIGYIHKNDVNLNFNNSIKYFEVTTDNLPIYDNRSGSLKKIGELTKGQVYERVSDYGNWHRIQFGKIYGYVRKDDTVVSTRNKVPNLNNRYTHSKLSFTTNKKAVVYDNTSGKLIPFATLERGVSYPIASDYGNWYRVIVSNKVGYVHKNDVNIEFNNNMRYFKVIEDNLPIYDNRSGSLVKVGSLKKGQVYERVSDYGNWHRIQFGNYYGYVRKSGTEVALTSTYSNRVKTTGNIGTLTPKKNVEVYDNTSGTLIPYATVDHGKTYPVIRDYGQWYEVNLAGRYGYVRKSDVTAIIYPPVGRTKVAQKTDQIVTVVGNGSKATVEFWYKSKSGDWVRSFRTNGYVGQKGVGKVHEGSRRTPKGAFKLGFAFGTYNPGTKMPFKQITPNSYWISNVNDPQYNTWQERKTSHPSDEHLIKYPRQYKYGIVINYNTRNPVKGAGSAFFLHVENGRATLGCVSILESRMVQLMRTLHDNAYIIIVNNEKEILNY